MLKKEVSQENMSKVWIRKDGIVAVELGKIIDEKDVNSLITKIENLLNTMPKKALLLINMSCVSPINSSQFRKRTAERMKNIYKNIGFRKVALFEKDIIWRTTASFLITATGLKEVKVFPTEKQALDWLKKA